MDEESNTFERGRQIVLGVATWSVLISASTILEYNLTRGHERLTTQLVRFALTCLVAFHLARGARWARSVTVVLSAITSVGSLVWGLGVGGTSTLSVPLLMMGVAYLVSTVLLTVPKSVIAFFDAVPPR